MSAIGQHDQNDGPPGPLPDGPRSSAGVTHPHVTLPSPEVPPSGDRPVPPKHTSDAALARTLAPDEVAGEAAAPPPELPVVEPASYHVACEIGQGGIGRVLMARDTRLRRPVAIKELLVDAGPEAEERFVREALLTARLQHPSIVPLYEAGRWPTGAPFYAMKLVSGRSLADVIAESPTLTARLGLLPHVLAVAEAMAYAHSERVIHRDLKPANVLVGAFGETVVIDWGLAKDLRADEPDVAGSHAPEQAGARPGGEALTLHGAVMGTPAYMPPEQARGAHVDERADVYALGAILYNLLAGASPYDGPSSRGILVKVMAGPPSPLGERQLGIPEDLLAIVNKAMAREPALRYGSAKQLADDLRRFQTGQIVGAHTYSKGELVRRFARRYRAALSVAAAALWVICVAGVVAFRQIVAESDHARAEQALSDAAERRAVARADDLTLVQAASAVERNPNRALGWLKTLSPSFERWPEARLIAADARAHGIATVLRGHTGALNAAVFAPDGKTVVTTSDDHTARLWDVATGASRVLAGHADEVWSAAFSADGAVLVTGSKDTTIRVWDVATGASRVLSGHTGAVAAVELLSGGLLVSSADDGTARLWDVASGAERAMLGPWVRGIAVAPDRRLVAVGGLTGALELWSPANGQIRELAGHHEEITGLVFSPDGRTLASRDRAGVLRLWDVATGVGRVLPGRQIRQTFRLLLYGKLAISPDGATLAAAGDGPFVRLLDLGTGAERRLEGPEGQTSAVTFSRDGRRVAAGSYDYTARVWDVGGGEPLVLRGFDDAVVGVQLSPDGTLLLASNADHTARLFPITTSPSRSLGEQGAALHALDIAPDGGHVVAAGDDGTGRLWDLASGAVTPLEGHVGPVFAARFSPDGMLVATAGTDGTTRLWDLGGHVLRIVHGRGETGPLSQLAFSADGRLLAAPGEAGAVQVLDVDSGAVRVLEAQEEPALATVVSPDGRLLASGGRAKTLRLWDLGTGAVRVLRGHTELILCATFSPDGRILGTGSRDHTLRLWDVETGEARIIAAGGAGIGQIAFTSDGKTVVTRDIYETGLRVWDAATGTQRALLRGHGGLVTRFALSPDDRRVVTAGSDKTLRLWDLESGAGRVLRGHLDIVEDVVFSPDGRGFASTGTDGTVRLWPDDLPDDPASLRSWIDAATPDTVPTGAR